MIFISYTKLVLRDYRQKRETSGFPLELREPTPGRLRDECLAVCNKRYDRKDEDALQKFFEDAHDKKTCLQSIERFDLDKFKPLVKFLRESTATTESKNIELLAWLIDFKGRPWDLTAPEPDADELADPTDVAEGRDTHETTGPEEKTSYVRKIVIVFTVTITLAAVVFYWFPSHNTFPPIPPGTQACMFWAEDHYQPVPCNEKLGDTVVIALDSEKLMRFRKITRPDTITLAAIGHVWYVRFRGDYEFYTSGGFHPLDPNLRLRPVTAYIISRHVPAK